MTEVEFHTGVADRVGFACRLLRKAHRQGAKVLVTAPAAVLEAIDRQLWAADPPDFVPHVRMPGAAAHVAARTSIWLALQADGVAGAPTLVLNVGAAAPSAGQAIARLIEVVSADADDAEAGRQRWRHYKAAGLAIRHHTMGPGAGP